MAARGGSRGRRVLLVLALLALAHAPAPAGAGSSRALVPAHVIVVADDDAARAKLVAEGFDPRRSAVVDRGEPGVDGLRGTAGSVRVVGDENARVVLRAALDARGLVVLNDQLTNGWSVQVDGRDADAVRVNEVMRGVVVGAGRHEIVWRYRVPGLRAGLLVSLLGLVVLAGSGVVLVRRRWAQPQPADAG